MAQFECEMPDDIFYEIEKLANSKNVAEKMLKAGGEIYRKGVERAVKGVIRHEDKNTGELAKSVKLSKVKELKSGGYTVKINFSGTDSKGIRNGLKAAELEYGNSHQPATPFMARANKDCAESAMAAMQEVFDQEAGK